MCPKCGYFNPSARALREMRQGKKSVSPQGRSPVVPPLPNAGVAPHVRPPSHDREDGTQMDVDQDS